MWLMPKVIAYVIEKIADDKARRPHQILLYNSDHGTSENTERLRTEQAGRAAL